MRLDYSIKDVEGRKAVVERELAARPHPSQRELSYMADYLLFASDPKQTCREKAEEAPIVTKNRAVTVARRETSLEDTVSSLPNGEDGLYSMMVDGSGMLLDHRLPISESDVDSIPGMRPLWDLLASLRKQLDEVDERDGKARYALKRQVISTYKELYAIKSCHMGPSVSSRSVSVPCGQPGMAIGGDVWLAEDGSVETDAPVSIMRPEQVSTLLRHYAKLKRDCWDDLDGDMRWLLMDLESVIDSALLPGHEMLYDLVLCEVDGMPGSDIVLRMEERYDVRHSEQYYSTMWRRRIPRMIAEEAQRRWLLWHFTYEDTDSSKWKVCKTCGRRLPAHQLFFNRNTSRDGFYSKCRECRSGSGAR